MLEIDRSTLIGKGLHRECYLHPQRPDRCVKIIVAGNSNENRREAGYYAKLARRGISWDSLTRFHGLVETSLGEGAVFDLVRDSDGAVSKTLGHYLASPQLTGQYADSLLRSLADLRAYLLQNRIVTMTLKTKNILYCRTGEADGRLVIVDNVGNTDFIPLTDYSATFARLKIARKWRRFEAAMLADYPDNVLLADWLQR